LTFDVYSAVKVGLVQSTVGGMTVKESGAFSLNL